MLLCFKAIVEQEFKVIDFHHASFEQLWLVNDLKFREVNVQETLPVYFYLGCFSCNESVELLYIDTSDECIRDKLHHHQVFECNTGGPEKHILQVQFSVDGRLDSKRLRVAVPSVEPSSNEDIGENLNFTCVKLDLGPEIRYTSNPKHHYLQHRSDSIGGLVKSEQNFIEILVHKYLNVVGEVPVFFSLV